MHCFKKIIFLTLLTLIAPSYAAMTNINYYVANQFDLLEAKTDGHSVWFNVKESDITIENGIADGEYVIVSGVKPFVRAKQKGKPITLIKGEPSFLSENQLNHIHKKMNAINRKIDRLSLNHKSHKTQKEPQKSFKKESSSLTEKPDVVSLKYNVKEGESLESLLRSWCQENKYQLFYLGPSYRLTANAHFEGTFEQVVKTLLISLNQSNLFLNATFYQKNRALVVKERFNEE